MTSCVLISTHSVEKSKKYVLSLKKYSVKSIYIMIYALKVVFTTFLLDLIVVGGDWLEFAIETV